MNSEQREFLANLSFDQLTRLMLDYFYSIPTLFQGEARELGITLEIVTLAINDRVYNSEI